VLLSLLLLLLLLLLNVCLAFVLGCSLTSLPACQLASQAASIVHQQSMPCSKAYCTVCD